LYVKWSATANIFTNCLLAQPFPRLQELSNILSLLCQKALVREVQDTQLWIADSTETPNDVAVCVVWTHTHLYHKFRIHLTFTASAPLYLHTVPLREFTWFTWCIQNNVK